MATAPKQITLDYKPRKWQHDLHLKMAKHRFAVLVCHRRAGKTIFLTREAVNTALTCPHKNPRVAIIYPLLSQAKRVAWDMLKDYVKPIPQIKILESELKIIFGHNGATIQLFGSNDRQYEACRGLRLNHVLIDEFGNCSPEMVDSVIRPAISDEKGKLTFMGTPSGKNHFYDQYQFARSHKDWLSFILKASESGLIDPDELASAKETMDEASFLTEFECSFDSAVKGAYFLQQLKKAREDNRISTFPHDPNKPVICAMDVGVNDLTVSWFCQLNGRAIHIIDCVFWRDTSLPDVFKDISRLPYHIVHIGLPVDQIQREHSTGMTRASAVEGLISGAEVTIVDYHRVDDGIYAVKSTFPQMYFDEQHCEVGLDELAMYSRKFSHSTNRFLESPDHKHSDYADGLRYLVALLDKLSGGAGIDETLLMFGGGQTSHYVIRTDGTKILRSPGGFNIKHDRSY